MPTQRVDITKQLLSGSTPSIFRNTNKSATINYLIIDGKLVPSHGKGKVTDTGAEIREHFVSKASDVVYIVSGASFGSFSITGAFNPIFTIAQSNDVVRISENLKGEILITDGTNAYIYNHNTGTNATLNKTNNNFDIADPIDSVMVDSVFICASRTNRFIQTSDPDNGLNWSSTQQFLYESFEDQIQALALIDRVLFVVAELAIERWTVNTNITSATAPFLVRDNMYLEEYGLVERKSFVNQFNRAVGIFASRNGGERVMVLSDGQGTLKEISNPGIIKEIRNSGTVISSELYEIDGVLLYELTLEKSKVFTSFIYNFSNGTWTQTTSPFQKVVYTGTNYFGSLQENIYELTLYENDQTKQVFMVPQAVNNDRFTVSEVQLFASFLWQKDMKDFHFGGTIDGTTEFQYTKRSPDINDNRYMQVISYYPKADGFLFAPYFYTASNAIIQKMTLGITKGTG